MSRDWEATFAAWGNPPSQTEQDQIGRAEREIRDALSRFTRLGDRRYRVYPKGSHRRGTNVRRGSDIDMAIELRGTADSESFRVAKRFSAKNLSDADLHLVDVSPAELPKLRLDSFKKDVHDALVAAFGAQAVTWSNKCLKVREGTSLPADVVPCRYYKRYDSASDAYEGIEIRPDKGSPIINWPIQDDDDGTAKNSRTNLRYKRAVRGLKALENEMTDNGVIQEVPSFLIECAVYNVPDASFAHASNYRNCLEALIVIRNAIQDESVYSRWEEVNGLKYLFRPSQPWTVDDAKRLVVAAFDYLGVS